MEMTPDVNNGVIKTFFFPLITFKKLGIEINGFVLEPLASSFSVLDKNEKDLGVVLIDIGGGTTDILIYYDGGIQHSSAIALAIDLLISSNFTFVIASSG